MCDGNAGTCAGNVVMFQCPGVGPSVCDYPKPIGWVRPGEVSMPRCGAFGLRQSAQRMPEFAERLFQCPGVGPSVCDLPVPSVKLIQSQLFQCPGVGPSVCDLHGARLALRQGDVSMPRCGAFGVRRGSRMV